MAKSPKILILDCKPNKAGDLYRVSYVAANGEKLAPMQGYNDVKAVKTGINSMRKCVTEILGSVHDLIIFRVPTDMTVLQKFAKSGYAVSGLKK